jgi:predicted aconitase with swiveling domain
MALFHERISFLGNINPRKGKLEKQTERAIHAKT